MGVRLALGATTNHITGLVMRTALVKGACGLAIGLPLPLVYNRALLSAHPMTWGSLAGLVGLLVMTSYLAARRAAATTWGLLRARP